MTKNNKKKIISKAPKIRVSIETKSDEVSAFDLVMHFTAEGQTLYVDENLRLVLDDLIKQHGEVFVKVNWFSSDVTVIGKPIENAL